MNNKTYIGPYIGIFFYLLLNRIKYLCPVYIEPVLRTTGAQPAHLLHLQKRLCAGLNLQGCAPTRIRAGRSTVVRRLWHGRSTIGAGCDTALSRSCDGCAPAVRRQEPVVVRLATLVPRSCYGCARVVPRSEPVDYCRLYNSVWKFDFYMLHIEKWIALTLLWKCRYISTWIACHSVCWILHHVDRHEKMGTIA